MLMKSNTLFKRARDQKGFTLVELLVVMAILAVLAALAVPRFGQILEDSRRRAHNENVQMINRAAQMFIAANGTVAVAADSGMATLAGNGFLSNANLVVPFGAGGNYTVAIADGVITITPGLSVQDAEDGSWTDNDTFTGP